MLASDGDLFLDLPVSSKQLRDRMLEEASTARVLQRAYFFLRALLGVPCRAVHARLQLPEFDECEMKKCNAMTIQKLFHGEMG